MILIFGAGLFSLDRLLAKWTFFNPWGVDVTRPERETARVEV